MSNRNGAVRFFGGGINSAAYWVGTTLLSASHVLNDSSVTGTTVKDALNYLSTSSTAVFPFVASGLAEQDLVSYDAAGSTWTNRTKAAALKGTGTDSFVVGSGSFAAGTNDIIFGPSSGASANTGNDNIGIGADTLDGATVALQNVIAIGGTALSGALTAAANGTVAIGAAAGSVLTSGAKNTFAGFQSGIAVATGSRNALYGYATKSAAGATDNTFIGNEVGTITVGSYNVAVGSQCLDGVTGALTGCVALGYSALSGSLTTAADGATAVGYIALGTLTTGAKNTAVGYQSGLFIIDGSRNSLFGWGTASSLSADDNTFIGSEAGSGNVGSRNTAIGSQAFNSATAAVTDCVALGYNALTAGISNTTPTGSVAVGVSALGALTTAVGCTALGYLAGALTTGQNNTIFGYNAAQTLTSGTGNTIIGANANCHSSSAVDNVIIGTSAGSTRTFARNVIMGVNAANSVGGASTLSDAVIIGYNAATSSMNIVDGLIAIGSSALTSLGSGATGNIGIGFQAGDTLTTGTSNTIVGHDADVTANSRSGCVILGRGASGAADDTLVIRMGNTSTKEIVVTPVVDATPPVGAVTYLPITIGGTQYRILLQAP